MLRPIFALPILFLTSSVGAQSTPQTSVRPAAYLFGTTEAGSGMADGAPSGSSWRDDAVSFGLGLDASRSFGSGRIDSSIFALAHDPLSEADRGVFAAGRFRAVLADAAWTFRIEDAPRIKRGDAPGLSDFQRNELSVEVEHRRSGPGLGVRLVDRRRSVPGDESLDFDRQSILAFVAGTTTRGAWRLEGGPQRYGTMAGDGWRITGAIDALRTLGRFTAALRFAWTEPIGAASGGAATGELYPSAAPTPTPTPMPMPGPELGPVGTESPPEDVETPAPLGTSMGPAPSLLGPSLVVDALDADEGDWDFGRRKQALVLVASHRLRSSLLFSLEAHLQRERGEDLQSPGLRVRRDRASARLSLRQELGTKAALVVQAGVRRVEDDRPGSSYTWGLACVGLELRP